VSEYQYYEFRAVDARLSDADMAALRSVSSRAKIAPDRLVNVYHYGDFRGDPLELMRRYFDAFVYEANWGSHELMLRLPRALLDAGAVAAYARPEGATLVTTATHTILRFESNLEESAWIDDSSHWLKALLPLRDEIAKGDLRPLYLGWLLWAHDYAEDSTEREPPVPAGLRTLTKPQESLAEFLRIDEELLAAAAERSASLPRRSTAKGALGRWLRALPAPEKDAILVRLVQGDEPALRAELLRRFEQATAPLPAPDAMPGRSIGELLAATGIEREEL
jgi:hypothetical protein